MSMLKLYSILLKVTTLLLVVFELEEPVASGDPVAVPVDDNAGSPVEDAPAGTGEMIAAVTKSQNEVSSLKVA